MDELVAKIVAATGADASVARRAAALILGFLLREGAPDKVPLLVDALPGAREAVAANPGSGAGGVMGVFNDLTAAGLGMGQIQGAAKAFIEYARGKSGGSLSASHADLTVAQGLDHRLGLVAGAQLLAGVLEVGMDRALRNLQHRG